MGNSVHFIPTKFIDCTPNEEKEEVSYGYRLGDDYESYYNNNYSCIEHVFDMMNNPEKLMDEIMSHSSDLHQYLVDSERPIWTGYDYIDSETYLKTDEKKTITGAKPVSSDVQDKVNKLLKSEAKS